MVYHLHYQTDCESDDRVDCIDSEEDRHMAWGRREVVAAAALD